MPLPAGFTQHASGYWMQTANQSGPYSFNGTEMTLVTAAAVAGAAAYPVGATPITSSSGNVANASAVATLAAAAGKTTYITALQITSGGSTAAALVLATLVGLLGGTATYVYATVAGATAKNPDLIIVFDIPLPASAVNTAIVLTLPALGAGNTNAAVSAQGFQL